MVYRCQWVKEDPIEQAYHDTEWGKVHQTDEALFEALTLELMQSGLSWSTILKKRANFTAAFAKWSIPEIAQLTPEKVDELMENQGIIRHRKKIEAVIANAQAAQELQVTFGDLATYFATFTVYMPDPKETALFLSKELKKRGFKFVGPTTSYSFMQAVGMVNDHEKQCAFREV